MEGANFGFGGTMDFDINFGADFAQEAQSFQKPAAGNTNAYFFGDEGIDTTTSTSFEQSFNSMDAGLYSMPESGFTMQQQNLVSPFLLNLQGA
jgi:hypothetical protein